MTLHQEREHPVEVPGCYACRISGVQFAPSAMPSRNEGAFARKNVQLEKQWDKDMDAYKRLRNDGLQPPQIDGAHVIEREAQTVAQVQTGLNSPVVKAQRAGYLDSTGAPNL